MNTHPLMTTPEPGDPTVDLLADYAADLFQSRHHPPAPTERDDYIEGDAYTGYLGDIPLFVCAHLRRLPVRYRRATVADLTPEQHCGDVAEFGVRKDDAPTLLIGGDMGTGKTFAAAACATAFALEAIGRGKPREGRVAFWTVAALLEAIRPGADDPERVWRHVKDAPLLVLDDWANLRVTEWAVERMWMLADHRYTAGLPQVVTLQAAWPAVVEAWGAATMDRLRDGARVLDFAGTSLRRRAGQ